MGRRPGGPGDGSICGRGPEPGQAGGRGTEPGRVITRGEGIELPRAASDLRWPPPRRVAVRRTRAGKPARRSHSRSQPPVETRKPATPPSTKLTHSNQMTIMRAPWWFVCGAMFRWLVLVSCQPRPARAGQYASGHTPTCLAREAADLVSGKIGILDPRPALRPAATAPARASQTASKARAALAIHPPGRIGGRRDQCIMRQPLGSGQ
jgi:hypothetical protein